MEQHVLLTWTVMFRSLAELDGLFRGEGDPVQSCVQRQKVGSFPMGSQGAFAAEENGCMRKPLGGLVGTVPPWIQEPGGRRVPWQFQGLAGIPP